MPGIRKLKIPNNIELKNPITNEMQGTWEFSDFCHVFLNLDYFKESIENLRVALSLSGAIKNTEPESEVLLNSDDLSKLVNIISDNFTKVININTLYLMQLLPFFDALTNCEEVK